MRGKKVTGGASRKSGSAVSPTPSENIYAEDTSFVNYCTNLKRQENFLPHGRKSASGFVSAGFKTQQEIKLDLDRLNIAVRKFAP